MTLISVLVDQTSLGFGRCSNDRTKSHKDGRSKDESTLSGSCPFSLRRGLSLCPRYVVRKEANTHQRDVKENHRVVSLPRLLDFTRFSGIPLHMHINMEPEIGVASLITGDVSNKRGSLVTCFHVCLQIGVDSSRGQR